MKALKYMDEEVVIKKGVDALVKELGPVEAMRFISLPKRKRMESVKRHREWQKYLNKENFFDEVFAGEVDSKDPHRSIEELEDDTGFAV